MILQAIMNNDIGRNQTLKTDTLKHLAYINKINNDDINKTVIKRFKNGSWIEEHTGNIIVTVNRLKDKNKKKLFYEEYQVIQRYKYQVDKTRPIGNGFYIKVLHATKPEYKLIDRLAITA